MAEAKAIVVIPRMDKSKTGVIMDVHTLVQCKDCQFGEIIKVNGKTLVACERERKARPLDWFCGDGEGKVENDWI